MKALLLRAVMWLMLRALPARHTECPFCGPVDPYDDVITPHDCLKEER